MNGQDSTPRRKLCEATRLRFEVRSVGAPGPIALLRAQMLALDIAPSHIDAAASRLLVELKGRRDAP